MESENGEQQVGFFLKLKAQETVLLDLILDTPIYLTSSDMRQCPLSTITRDEVLGSHYSLNSAQKPGQLRNTYRMALVTITQPTKRSNLTSSPAIAHPELSRQRLSSVGYNSKQYDYDMVRLRLRVFGGTSSQQSGRYVSVEVCRNAVVRGHRDV
jgi:hypothetical protein